MTAPTHSVKNTAFRGEASLAGTRTVAEEVPVAFTYGGSTHAVMMATPADLADFAVGLTLTEGIAASPEEISSIEIVEEPIGIELRIALAGNRATALAERRRMMTGPVGCGLCGIESLEEALRPVPKISGGIAIRPADIHAALDATRSAQALNRLTHAVHAAAFWTPGEGLVAVREDVGRHNALDKLAGALAKAGVEAATGVVVLTSRLSVELVQKAAAIGAPILVAVSAPTALALKTAGDAGITVIAVARADGFEVFTHASRIVSDDGRRVAS